MMEKIGLYFLFFILYSIIGWICEVISKLRMDHRFINRGFLIGPYCPIYGIGALLITFMLTKYENDILVLFCMTIFWCSILEYMTSYIMEKIFKTRWWDYSDKSCNLNGRICLSNAILFGIGGVVAIKLINPILLPWLFSFSSIFLGIFSVVFFLVFVFDVILSYGIIVKFSKTARMIAKDSTEDMRELVRKSTLNMKEEFTTKIKKFREETTLKLKNIYENKNIFQRRFITAFPNLEIRNTKLEKKIQNFIKNNKQKRKWWKR